MSVVTNIIITCSVLEDMRDDNRLPPPIAKLNEWLGREGHGTFTDIGQYAGGYKHLEARVYGVALNGFWQQPDMMRLLPTLLWEEPHFVRVLIQEQDDSYFSVFAIGERGTYNLA